MPTTDYTEFLHNVKQEFITNSYELNETFVFDIELPVKLHICPKYGGITKHIKDYRIRTVKFGKVQQGPLIGKYRQRRYICPHCKHSFSESNPFVRKHMQLSVTNIRMLFDKLTESVTYNAIAKECDTSITTVLRYCSMITIPKPRTLPTVIRINEFKGNAEGYQYHVCRLVDWAVERVRKREQHKLAAYSRMLKQNRRVLMKHLTHWLELVKVSGLNEFSNFFTSFPTWMTQLTNAFLLPYSNGYTEETNNKIKVLKRISYGLRHFGRFRVRILLLSKKEMANLH